MAAVFHWRDRNYGSAIERTVQGLPLHLQTVRYAKARTGTQVAELLSSGGRGSRGLSPQFLENASAVPDPTSLSLQIQGWIDRLADGDESAREHLLNCACDRMTRITRKIKSDFPNVARWEQTDDIMNNAALRLYKSLADVKLSDVRHFYRLAALQIRRELIDLARHYRRLGDHHRTQDPNASLPAAHVPGELTFDPGQIAEWGEFHEQIESLPDELRETVDLLWYHGLTQEEAASVLGISTRQVKRRWRSARLMLHDQLGDAPNNS